MKAILIIILIIVFFACTKNNGKIIKFTEAEIQSLGLDSVQGIKVQEDSAITVDLNAFLKKGEFNFGELIKSIYVVPLETTEENLIAAITNILVTDSAIYVTDEFKRGSIVIFDKKGKFIKRIAYGQGPGDILDLKFIAFDKDLDELIVFHNHYFSFFTPDGKFKRRDRIPLNAISFALLPDGYIFHSMNGLNNNHINPDNVEYLIFTTDRKYRLKSIGFPYQYRRDNIYDGLNGHIHLNSNEINFTFKFTNSIYNYINDYETALKYRIDISDKSIPDNLLQSDYNTLKSGLKNNNYFFFLGDYVENSNHNFFQLINLYSNYTFIYRDKASGHCAGGSITIVNRELYVPLNKPIASYGNYFVSYYLPGDEWTHHLTPKIFPEDVVKKLKSLTSDDNPVIVFYELKDF